MRRRPRSRAKAGRGEGRSNGRQGQNLSLYRMADSCEYVWVKMDYARIVLEGRSEDKQGGPTSKRLWRALAPAICGRAPLPLLCSRPSNLESLRESSAPRARHTPTSTWLVAPHTSLLARQSTHDNGRQRRRLSPHGSDEGRTAGRREETRKETDGPLPPPLLRSSPRLPTPKIAPSHDDRPRIHQTPLDTLQPPTLALDNTWSWHPVWRTSSG